MPPPLLTVLSLTSSFISFLILLFIGNGAAIRCYSDHSGPNSAGGVERCDDGAVCSSSRIVYREEGVLRKAMARQCVTRTPDRSGEVWPWCHEEWAGGDEGGMEVLTCYCNTELCNDNTFLRGRFGEWVASTMARLKAGPTYVMDIAVTVATVCVVLFFAAVIISNIPWSRLRSSSRQEEEEEEKVGEHEEEGGDDESESKEKTD